MRKAAERIVISEDDVRTLVRELLLMEQVGAVTKAAWYSRAGKSLLRGGLGAVKFGGKNWRAIISPTGQFFTRWILRNKKLVTKYLGENGARAHSFIKNMGKKDFYNALGGDPGIDAWKQSGVIKTGNPEQFGWKIFRDGVGPPDPTTPGMPPLWNSDEAVDTWEFITVGNKRYPIPAAGIRIENSAGDILIEGNRTVKAWGNALDFDPMDIKFPKWDDPTGGPLLKVVAETPVGVLSKLTAVGTYAGGMAFDAYIWHQLFGSHPLGAILNEIAEIIGAEGFEEAANLNTMYSPDLANKLIRLNASMASKLDRDTLPICVSGGTYYFNPKGDAKVEKVNPDARQLILAGMVLLAQIAERERYRVDRLSGQTKEFLGDLVADINAGQTISIPESVLRDIHDLAAKYKVSALSSLEIIEKTASIWEEIANRSEAGGKVIRLADFSQMFKMLSGRGIETPGGGTITMDGMVKDVIKDYLDIQPADRIYPGFLTDPGIIENIPVAGGLLGLVKYGMSKSDIEFMGSGEVYGNEIIEMGESELETRKDEEAVQERLSAAISSVRDSLSSIQTAVLWENINTESPTANYATNVTISEIEDLIIAQYETPEEFWIAWEEELDSVTLPDTSTDGLEKPPASEAQPEAQPEDGGDPLADKVRNIFMGQSVDRDLDLSGFFNSPPVKITGDAKDLLIDGGEKAGRTFIPVADLIDKNYSSQIITVDGKQIDSIVENTPGDGNWFGLPFTLALVGMVTGVSPWDKATLGVKYRKFKDGRYQVMFDKDDIARSVRDAITTAAGRTQ